MKKSIKILYVDDDADDRNLLYEAIKDVNPSAEVELAENGLKALDYLKMINENGSTLPCLIILDINMPFLDGKETLQQIRKDKNFENVPVVIFTSSHRPNDKAMFNSLGIDFISKPESLSHLNKIASQMLSKCAGG
jgi:CheY-like chemotaxis protein